MLCEFGVTIDEPTLHEVLILVLMEYALRGGFKCQSQLTTKS